MIQIKMCCADVKRPLQKTGFLRFFVTKGEIPQALFGTCYLLFDSYGVGYWVKLPAN